MKKLIPFLMLLAVGASSALAQGTVLFGNSNLPRQGTTGGSERRVFQPDMTTPVFGAQYQVELLYQDNTGTWVAHPTRTTFFPTTSATLNGYWIGGNRTLVNAGGMTSPTVNLQVRVWDNTTGATYDLAGIKGQSTIFSYTEEFDAPPANTDDKWMKNFQSFSLVPEPSVIGLGLIGVGALFMLRRRK